MLYLGVVLCCSILGANGIYYDSYRGVPISKHEYQIRQASNATFWCVTSIQQCDPEEFRRVDGSCNNLKHPARGATHTPFYRVLPPNFSDNVSKSRKSKSGNDLPLERYTRTSLLPQGRVPDQTFTLLVPNFLLYLNGDITNVHDTFSMVAWFSKCCEPEGLKEEMCHRSVVPNDDPVFRYSNIRCLSVSKPFSFQNRGCVNKNTPTDRIVSATPTIDLSVLYGNTEEENAARVRKFKGGLLKSEDVDGSEWPPAVPADKPELDLCSLNVKPHETRCHHTAVDANGLLGQNMFGIWFWRMHNVFARKLAQVNPCWNDDKLFFTARDINIAIFNQIVYYELFPNLFGRSYLQKLGVISSTNGFRDEYNENLVPQTSIEALASLRWAHTLQEGILKLYDEGGNYVKQVPVVNITQRTGFLAIDKNLAYLTQGCFRQASAKFDNIYDPDIVNLGLGALQKATDIPSNDLLKNRMFGFQPYIKYHEICTGNQIESFRDLKDVFAPEILERLSDVYESVEDIDLMAGIWTEKPLKTGYVPPTFACLFGKLLLHNMWSDRHWYERPNRPHAFTYEQLQEIRKYTISRFMCDVGDSVTEIQPEAFFRIGPKNPLVPCDQIPNIDFKAWEDLSCKVHYQAE